MKVSLHGSVTKPAVIAVGTWDPILPIHGRLFDELTCYARSNSLSSVIVVIDPPPTHFIGNDSARPVYTDVHARIKIIQGFGIDGVLRIHFRRADLSAGASELLDTMLPLVSVRELWLGMGQSLGRGIRGSVTTITALAAQHGICLRVMPAIQLSTRRVYQLLTSGRIVEAALVVGRPAIRSRPRRGSMRMAWGPGRYLAMPLSEPTDGIQSSAEPVLLRLSPRPQGQPVLVWPGATRYLAFVCGPADLTPQGEVVGDG